MYADGGAEEVVGQAIRGLRDRVVLVSKVYPWHAGGAAMRRACETACAGCRPTIWICISCTGGAISR
jgi:diketogulonate reductase-like aldo/keto reductase